MQAASARTACVCGSTLPAALCCAWVAQPAPGGLPSSEAAARALESGDAARAERLALELLALHPGNVDALTVVFLIREETGPASASLALLQRMARLDPNLLWVREQLVSRLLQARRLPEAEAHARDAVRLDPRHAGAHHGLGAVFNETGRLADAEFHFRRALALCGGGNAVVLANLGWNLKMQGGVEASRACYEQSIALDDGIFLTWLGWARMEASAGDLEAARARLDRALALEPSHTEALLLDAVLRSRQGDAPRALRRLQMLTRQDIGDGAAAVALEEGRILDSLGRYADAYAAWDKGKALLRAQGRAYHAQAAAEQDRRLRGFFVAGRLRLLPLAARTSGPRPIFVCGAPGSGGGSLAHLLSRHPQIVAAAAPGALADVIARASRTLDSELAYPEVLADLWLADRRDGLDRLRDAYLRAASRSFAAHDDQGEPARACGHGERVCEGSRFFIDCTPFNETQLGMMGLMFPHAPVIHMLRHPLDVVLSMFAHDAADGMDCALSLETAAREYARVAGLVEHYRVEMPLRYLSVRQEDLMRDPRGELRRIAGFIGLADDPGLMAPLEEGGNFEQQAGSPRAQRDDPHYPDYRNYLEQLAPVMPMLAQLIHAQGYSIESLDGQPG